ncbi:Cna B-type domain-containing protein, partial [Facklamia languida]
MIVVEGKIDTDDKSSPIYQVGIEYNFKDIEFGVDPETNEPLTPLYKLERFNTVNFTPSSSSADGEAGITIVNSEKIDISAFKEWKNPDDAEGKEIRLKLFANGEPTEHTVILNGSTDSYTSNDGEYYPWRASFGDLPAKDKNGKLIEYSVKEYSIKDGVEVEGLDGFKTTYAPESLTAETFSKFITVTNTKEDEKVTVLSEKVWQKDGKPTEENAKPTVDTPDVYFQLMNGDSKAEVPEGQSNPVQYTGKTVSWENLPKVDAEGKDIQYTVKEVDEEGNDWKAPGYTASEPTVQDAVADNPDTEEDGTQPKTFTFTNNYETTSVKVTKKWTNVPESATKPEVYFQLMNGEQSIDEPMKLSDDSTVVWEDLPKAEFDSEGNVVDITYTVKEVDENGNDWQADNYTAGEVTLVEGSRNEFTVENTYKPTPGQANITATKVLTGRDLADGEFEFVLTETTEGVEKPHTETVTNVGENITFAPITYDKA